LQKSNGWSKVGHRKVKKKKPVAAQRVFSLNDKFSVHGQSSSSSFSLKRTKFYSLEFICFSVNFQTFLPISSARSFLLSSYFFALLWQFHGIGQHSMTRPDLRFILLFSSFFF
jgi:hypothetical protein